MRAFHLLVNPSSGGGSAPAAVVPVARLLREAGARVEVTYSPGPVACQALVAEAVARSDVVVAVGGDGMVASLAGSVVAHGGVLGIVPSGRGNDFARQLGLPSQPDEIAQILLRAAPRAVDVIEAAGHVVVGSVYVGVDSVASELVNSARHVPRRLLYQYAAVRALATYEPCTYRIEVDGTFHEHRAATVVVANSGYYGNGMHIAPTASVEDGLLDVVVVRAASRLQLIRWLPKLYDGSHVELDEVLVLTGRSVAISSDSQATAYGDGELLARLPVTATLRPAALQVLA
ncbi:MAG: diacylglycerol/lipid kinase family protein [Actinomycetes bacterium]